MGRAVRPHQGRQDPPARLRWPPLRATGPRRGPHRPGADPHAATEGRLDGHRRLHGVQGPATASTTTPVASPGASAYWRASGEFVTFEAKTVIIATGGVGKSWKFTSNSWECTGDGQAMSLWAGAKLIDMECIQFHPTGMVWPLSVRGLLVTESVRGDGGVLRNSEGKRFMFNYVPEMFRAETAETEEEGDKWYDDHSAGRRPPELLPRDEVARAINSEVKAGRGTPHGGVFLDIASRRTPEYIRAPTALDVPPVHGARRRRHHHGPDGDRTDLSLHHGRRRGRSPTPPRPPSRVCSPPAKRPAACTAPTDWVATRSRDLWSSAAAPDGRGGVRRSGDFGDVASTRIEVEPPVQAALAPLRPRGRREPVHDPAGPAGHDAGNCRHHPHRVRRSGRGAGEARGASTSGSRPSRSRATRQYNPGWNLATDLPAMLTVVEAATRGDSAQGESRRSHPRRLPEPRPRVRRRSTSRVTSEGGNVGTVPITAAESPLLTDAGRTEAALFEEAQVMADDRRMRVWRGDGDRRRLRGLHAPAEGG